MPAVPGSSVYLGSTLIAGGVSGCGEVGDLPPYVRPSDWPALPTVSPGDQKIVALVAVHNDSTNFVALLCRGAYTVDWGDGTAPENVADNVKAQHSYSYGASGLSAVTTRGYKVATVTVTPQAANSFTVVNFQQSHSSARTGQSTKWLDVKMASSTLTALIVGSSAVNAPMRSMERFEFVGIPASALTSLTSTFMNCTGLQEVAGMVGLTTYATALGAAGGGMFQNCSSLRETPDLTMTSVTTLRNVFAGCSRVQSVRAYNTTGVTEFIGAVSGTKITVAPDWDVSNATALGNIFQDCVALVEGPAWDTAGVTNFASMFKGCTSLVSCPAYNTSSVGSTTNGMINMFDGCVNLVAAPMLDTTGVTSLIAIFNGCTSLKYVPDYNTASCTAFGTAFQNCSSLVVIPAWNMAAVTTSANLSNAFNGCVSVERFRATGITRSFSVADCNMAAAELNEMYTNLGTGVSATVTVTGNSGTSSDNPAIATAKSWTVTG